MGKSAVLSLILLCATLLARAQADFLSLLSFEPRVSGVTVTGTPVDMLVIPNGSLGVIIDTTVMSNSTLGGGSWGYADGATELSHTYLTNTAFTRRTPFNFGGTLYSNFPQSIWFSMVPDGIKHNESVVWSPAGMPEFYGVSACITLNLHHYEGIHNFDMVHLQSTNYSIAQMQVNNNEIRVVAHSEPSTAGNIQGLTTNTFLNFHVRQDVARQRAEVIVVDAITGEVLGAATKPITTAQGYGTLGYLRIGDYLWNTVDSASLGITAIALRKTGDIFPLEPITVPNPTDVYASQVDTNVIRLVWTGRGTEANIERNSGSGFITLTNGYVSPVAMGENGRVLYDSNLTEGVTYTYRITSSIGTYSSASVASGSVYVTNTLPGFETLWQQETNEAYTTGGIYTQVGFPAIEQRIKAINQSTALIYKVAFNYYLIENNTATNGETIQVSIFSETNRGGVFYGTSRGTVIGTNIGWKEFVFFNPIPIPPGSNFWLSYEGNWLAGQLWGNIDEFGYLPGQGFDLLQNGSSNISGGFIGDLDFKIFIRYTPLPVAGVTTNQVADTQVTLTWPDSNQGLVRYKVDQYHGSWTDNVTNTIATNVTIAGLTIGETYKWRVYSYIPGETGSESAKVESPLITMADLPLVTNDFVVSYTGISELGTSDPEQAGIRITVGANDITLTQFGAWISTPAVYMDVNVWLKNSSCTALASNTVSITGAVDDAFNWAPVQAAPVTLSAGGTYYIVRDVGFYNGWYTGTTGVSSDATIHSKGYGKDCTTGLWGAWDGGVNFRYYVP